MRQITHVVESVAGLAVLAGIVASTLMYLAGGKNDRMVTVEALGKRPYFYWQGNEDPVPDEEIRKTIISYLAVPELAPEDILKQMNNSDARVIFYTFDEERLYCAIKRENFSGPEDFELLTDYPENILRGTRDGDYMVLGDYQLPDIESVFFSLPASDLRLFPDARLTHTYPSAVYSLSIRELVNFHYNRAIYGGFYVNRCRTAPEELTAGPINCGAFVTYPGEPSLKALMLQLTEYTNSPEFRAQALLDFVTREVKLESRGFKPPQAIKKPNEILMTGQCGLRGKAILYCSLLEQTEIDYLLAYTDDQVQVLVAGDFPQQRNALDMRINGTLYHLAAVTARGFRIGNPAPDGLTADQIRWIQRPGINSALIELPPPEDSSGKRLMFSSQR
jgi:hypothetical protein